MTSRFWRVAVGCVLATTCVFAQATPGFEVVSVKRNVSNSGGSFFRFEPDGGVRVSNTSLRDIVRLAYFLDAYQADDWPRWMAGDRYDILAKPQGIIDHIERPSEN